MKCILSKRSIRTVTVNTKGEIVADHPRRDIVVRNIYRWRGGLDKFGRIVAIPEHSDDDVPPGDESESSDDDDVLLADESSEDESEYVQCSNEDDFWNIISISAFDPRTGEVARKIDFDRDGFSEIYLAVEKRLRRVIDGIVPEHDMERVISHYIWQGMNHFRTACEDPVFVTIDYSHGACFGYLSW